MRDVNLSHIDVTGYSGSLIYVHHVTGKGISKAKEFSGPAPQPLMPPNYPTYKLH